MSENSWDPENDTPLVKRLRAEIETRDKRLNELDKTVNELTGKVRTQTVSDVLREIGAKPALSKFLPPGLETTKEAVAAWLKENEELFGPVGASADGQSNEQAAQEPQVQPTATLAPAATPAQVAAFQRMSNSDNNTTTLLDVETANTAQLGAMAQAANGDFDKYLAYLRGEIKLS